MYAVTFDIDTNCLNQDDSVSQAPNVYGAIRKFMENNGFIWKQGSVYFGTDEINAVTCVTVIQKLVKEMPVFAICVKDVRMLKIEENNDLMPAIKAVL